MILKCRDCGFEKEMLECEVIDNMGCEICGGDMFTQEMLDELEKDRAVGDNFPVIPQREEHKEENKQLKEMAEQEVKNNINILGESHTYYLIEALSDIELRIKYRNVFFKLGYEIPIKDIFEERFGNLYVKDKERTNYDKL